MQAAPVQIPSTVWDLALHQPQIDPRALIQAIEGQIRSADLDFRTRVLVRDAILALRGSCGEDRVSAWIAHSTQREQLERIARENLGAAGFPSLAHRVMESTKSETVRQFLRELGQSISQPTRLVIGGSIALILPPRISRHTEDIDVVDEIPKSLREEHALLDRLAARYGLRIAHFRSHFLPDGWQSRLKPLGTFDRLDVSLVDEYDIMLSKFFSRREKDRDDLRVLATGLDKALLIERLHSSAGRLLGESQLRQNAVDNWQIVYGESLPA